METCVWCAGAGPTQAGAGEELPTSPGALLAVAAAAGTDGDALGEKSILYKFIAIYTML